MSSRLISRMRNLAVELAIGINTRGMAETNIPDGKPYATLDYGFIETILNAMQLTASDVFVDIGCGRGRALCSAARRSVQEAIGIEGDPAIAAQCESNVNRLRRRGKISAGKVTVVAKLADDDSVDAVWKIGTAYYLFCPFGEKTLFRVAAKIRQFMTRPVRIAYINPTHERVLADAGFRRSEALPRDTSRELEHPVSFWNAPEA